MGATQKYADGREGEKHLKILFSYWHALMVEVSVHWMTSAIMTAIKYDQMKVNIVNYRMVKVVYEDFAIIFEAFILYPQN